MNLTHLKVHNNSKFSNRPARRRGGPIASQLSSWFFLALPLVARRHCSATSARLLAHHAPPPPPLLRTGHCATSSPPVRLNRALPAVPPWPGCRARAPPSGALALSIPVSHSPVFAIYSRTPCARSLVRSWPELAVSCRRPPRCRRTSWPCPPSPCSLGRRPWAKAPSQASSSPRWLLRPISAASRWIPLGRPVSQKKKLIRFFRYYLKRKMLGKNVVYPF
jgi:hypothetical protein